MWVLPQSEFQKSNIPECRICLCSVFCGQGDSPLVEGSSRELGRRLSDSFISETEGPKEKPRPRFSLSLVASSGGVLKSVSQENGIFKSYAEPCLLSPST